MDPRLIGALYIYIFFNFFSPEINCFQLRFVQVPHVEYFEKKRLPQEGFAGLTGEKGLPSPNGGSGDRGDDGDYGLIGRPGVKGPEGEPGKFTSILTS